MYIVRGTTNHAVVTKLFLVKYWNQIVSIIFLLLRCCIVKTQPAFIPRTDPCISSNGMPIFASSTPVAQLAAQILEEEELKGDTHSKIFMRFAYWDVLLKFMP